MPARPRASSAHEVTPSNAPPLRAMYLGLQITQSRSCSCTRNRYYSYTWSLRVWSSLDYAFRVQYLKEYFGGAGVMAPQSPELLVTTAKGQLSQKAPLTLRLQGLRFHGFWTQRPCYVGFWAVLSLRVSEPRPDRGCCRVQPQRQYPYHQGPSTQIQSMPSRQKPYINMYTYIYVYIYILMCLVHIWVL